MVTSPKDICVLSFSMEYKVVSSVKCSQPGEEHVLGDRVLLALNLLLPGVSSDCQAFLLRIDPSATLVIGSSG